MYVGYPCKNCNRLRVEKTEYGDVCEKCDWNQDSNEYNGTDAIESERMHEELSQLLFNKQ